MKRDEQALKICDALFAFQPPTGRALPTFDAELFSMPEDRLDVNWAGLCRGEALSGLHPNPQTFIWPEVSHVDIFVGRSAGPAGYGMANALTTQSHGFNNLYAVVNPNLVTLPTIAMVTKVKTDTRVRANQMFGSCQSGVADAVVDCLEAGFFPEEFVHDLVGVVSVFVDPNAGTANHKGKPVYDRHAQLVPLEGVEAEDSAHRLYSLNYISTCAALWMAVTGGRSVAATIAAKKACSGHVLRGFNPIKAEPAPA